MGIQNYACVGRGFNVILSLFATEALCVARPHFTRAVRVRKVHRYQHENLHVLLERSTRVPWDHQLLPKPLGPLYARGRTWAPRRGREGGGPSPGGGGRRSRDPQPHSLRAPPWLRRPLSVRCSSACSAWRCPAARCTPRAPCLSTPSPSTRYRPLGACCRAQRGAREGGCGRVGSAVPPPRAVPRLSAPRRAGPESRGSARRARGCAARRALGSRNGRGAGPAAAQPIAERQPQRAANRRGPSGAVPRGPARPWAPLHEAGPRRWRACWKASQCSEGTEGTAVRKVLLYTSWKLYLPRGGPVLGCVL